MTDNLAPIRIVCLGASNTEGYGVAFDQSYPMHLHKLLQSRGIEHEVLNAGISGDTTTGMLSRLDAEVPEHTRIVIFQPGINDLSQPARREANIAAILARLAARDITVIMLDNAVIRGLPPRAQAWDGIHLTAEGYAMLAEAMLPQVLAAIGARG
jgi:acyl-CoA thioesterase-1